MRKISFVMAIFLTALFTFGGCSNKVDDKHPLEKIKEEAAAMSLEKLEARANDYAKAIKAKRGEISKIQEKIKKMPVEKIFKNKSLTQKITKIGREAMPLFERYQIYAGEFVKKGGEVAKVQLK